jgi:CcmD family protein
MVKRTMKRVVKPLLIGLCSLCLTAPAWALQPPKPQNEFVPVEQLPPGDQLPSAPLLVAAYAFVWLAVMFYLWSIWRRLNKVEADIRALEQRQGTQTRR